jgi:hypothetical protein
MGEKASLEELKRRSPEALKDRTSISPLFLPADSFNGAYGDCLLTVTGIAGIRIDDICLAIITHHKNIRAENHACLTPLTETWNNYWPF